MHSFSRKMRTSTIAAFTLMLSVGVIPAVTPTNSDYSPTPAAHAQEATPPEPPVNYRSLPGYRGYDSCSSDRNYVYAKTWWDKSVNTRQNGGKDVSIVEVTIPTATDLTRSIDTKRRDFELSFGSDKGGWRTLKNGTHYTVSVSGNRIFFRLNEAIQRAPSNIDSYDAKAKIPLRGQRLSTCPMTLWHEGPGWFDRTAKDANIDAPETPPTDLEWLPPVSDNPSLPQRCGGKIALVFDTSGSIRENNDIGVVSSKNAGLSVINALQGTGSEMAIYNFASKAKSLPRMSTNELLSLDNADDAQKLRSAVEAIDDIKKPNGRDGLPGTNYQDGLRQVPEGVFDIVYFITDGFPTTNNNDYPYGFDSGVYTHQSDISSAILESNRLKESNTRIETVMVGIGSLNEYILKDNYFNLSYVNNKKTPNIPGVIDSGISKEWPYQNDKDGYGYPSFYKGERPRGGYYEIKDMPKVRDLAEKGSIMMFDAPSIADATIYEINKQPKIWRAGVLSPESIGKLISSNEAVTTVNSFNDLVDRLNELVLKDCFGSINVTKHVHGEDGSVTPGKDWSFETKVDGDQAAIIDGEGGTERKAQVTDVTGEDGRYGRTLDQQNGQGQSITVVEHQQPGHKLHKQGDKNAVCTTRVREGNSWKTMDSEVRNIDDVEKPGFGVEVPFRGIVNCTIENDTVSVKIDLSVQKVSFDDKPQPLEGAEFTLNKVDGDNREYVGTIRDGETRIVDLQPGNRYELVETQAPSGYQLLSSPIYFNIAVGESGKPEIVIEGGKDQYPEISIQEDEKDANHSVMQVADIRKGDLPNTGGRGLGGLALLASVVATAAVFIGRRALN